MKRHRPKERTEGDERSRVALRRNQSPELTGRVVELERRLRRRTISLGGALAASIAVACLPGFSMLRSDDPNVSISALSSSEPPISGLARSGKADPLLEIDYSPAWALGEDQIEKIALLHLERQNVRAHDDQLSTAGPGVGKREVSRVDQQESHSIRGVCPPMPAGAPRNGRLLHDPPRMAATRALLPYAATASVNLRATPSTSAEILAVVGEGDLVRRTGREIGWLQVEYRGRAAKAVKGWVYSGHLQRIDRLSDARSSPAAKPNR